MSEYIKLRACGVVFPKEDGDRESYPGVMLPDGRILVWSPAGNSVTSIVSEAALAVEYPGAKLYFHPDADAAVNNTGAYH